MHKLEKLSTRHSYDQDITPNRDGSAFAVVNNPEQNRRKQRLHNLCEEYSDDTDTVRVKSFRSPSALRDAAFHEDMWQPDGVRWTAKAVDRAEQRVWDRLAEGKGGPYSAENSCKSATTLPVYPADPRCSQQLPRSAL